jgi:hypothetical protein
MLDEDEADHAQRREHLHGQQDGKENVHFGFTPFL